MDTRSGTRSKQWGSLSDEQELINLSSDSDSEYQDALDISLPKVTNSKIRTSAVGRRSSKPGKSSGNRVRDVPDKVLDNGSEFPNGGVPSGSGAGILDAGKGFPNGKFSSASVDLKADYSGASGAIQLTKTVKDSECLFCTEILKPGIGVVLNSCLHNFCRDCLRIAVQESSFAQIPCPVAAETGCKGVLSDAEIGELVSRAEYKKYMVRSIKDIPCQVNGGKDFPNDDLPPANGNDLTNSDLPPANGNDFPNSNFPPANGNDFPISNLPPANGNDFPNNNLPSASGSSVPDELNAGNDFPNSNLSYANASAVLKAAEYSSAGALDSNPTIELIRTFENSECLFCTEILKPGIGIVLNSCLHNFCRDCVRIAVEESSVAQIPCPVSVETGCNGVLLDPEIRALVSPAEYEKYMARSINLAENQIKDVFRCRNSECNVAFSVPDTTELDEYLCPNCSYLNCLKCKVLKGQSGCKCCKRSAEEGSEGANKEKMCRLDPQLKKDWDANWQKIYESVKSPTAEPHPSTSRAAFKQESCESLKEVLEKMISEDILKSRQEFDCSICISLVQPEDSVILKECFHMFCQECLSGTIEHSEDPKVKCPFQINDYSCSSYISDREVKALLSAEAHEKYLTRSVNQAEMCIGNSYHCKTVNCTGWCEFEEGVPEFLCPVCTKRNCLKCKAVHETKSCVEYQAQLHEDEMDVKTKKMIQDLLEKKQAMKCPTCKVIIQKISGCDGVTCTVCKTAICWATFGPRWGPKGPGDSSGGCQCRSRENRGRMCHPKCKGCH